MTIKSKVLKLSCYKDSLEENCSDRFVTRWWLQLVLSTHVHDTISDRVVKFATRL